MRERILRALMPILGRRFGPGQEPRSALAAAVHDLREEFRLTREAAQRSQEALAVLGEVEGERVRRAVADLAAARAQLVRLWDRYRAEIKNRAEEAIEQAPREERAQWREEMVEVFRVLDEHPPASIPTASATGGRGIAVSGRTPRIADSAFIADTARVAGDVEVGEEASIWFGASVRGEGDSIRIGRRTNIQDGCVLHVDVGGPPVVIGDGVIVGHACVLHGCQVEDGALIGMGSIVMNGCRVGQEAMVAAGSLLLDGTVVPPRTLVMGRPARVKRDLTPAEVETIRAGAAHYVEHARWYQGA